MQAAESTHYYDRKGNPCYTQTARAGHQRPTTLADARKLELVPSFTEIAKCAAKPALTTWLIKQAVLSSLTLTRLDGESDDDWIARILSDSKEEGKNAATDGTAIHDAISASYERKPFDAIYDAHVAAATEAIHANFGAQAWTCGTSFAHPLGFGGKTDQHCATVLLDIKTKEFGPDDKVVAYDEHAMQLAAYERGLWHKTGWDDLFECANVFVSRSHPGLVRIVRHDRAEIDRGWEQFKCLLRYWQVSKRLDTAFQ